MRAREFNRIRDFGLRLSEVYEKADRVVSKVALMCDGKLCMGKRNDNGLYTQPGGHCEDGESPEQGAIRECMEETGIELDPSELKPLARSTVEDDGEKIEVHAFQAEVDSSRTTTKEDPDSEVSKWEWIDIQDGKLPSEILSNLHVPPERDVVLQALGLVKNTMGEDAKPAAAKPAAAPAPIKKPDPLKGVQPAKPAAAAPPPEPVPPSDAKLDAVKKLQKMGDKAFKMLDDMAIFANESGLKDVAAMVGKVEDAYWDMKRNLSKIRESQDDRTSPLTENHDAVVAAIFDRSHSARKPTSPNDVVHNPADLTDADKAAIKKLPVIQGKPGEDFSFEREGLPQYFVYNYKGKDFLVDTQGYDYPRYMLYLPR